jgi:tetratricopeptide (TPR) repeat protein
MSSPDNLYTLISSLSKAEKAYFKKFASRHVLGEQNKYVILFDEISRSRNGYDEKAIRKKFGNEKFVKNYPVMKNYLYELIMKSLNSNYSDSGSENEVKNKVRNIEILYKKGLFTICAKLLKSSIKRAYRNDNFPVILDLLRWKRNLINEGVFKENAFFELEKAYKEETEVINKIRNLNEYRVLSYRARSIVTGTNPYHKGKDAIDELINILHDQLLVSETQALSYSAIITYYHILALIHESLANNMEALDFKKRLIEVMEKNPQKLEENISNYVISLFNLLSPCLLLKKYDDLADYIKKLKSIEKTYPGRISEGDRLLIFTGSSIFELRMHINTGRFSNSEKNIKEIETGLSEFSDKIIKDDILHCYYMLGYANFGAGKIEEALKWINRILNDKEINHNSRLFVKTGIINLIIHYELGNYELLDSLIKSTYRYLRKSSISGRNENIVIEFLRRLTDITSQSQIIGLFAETLDKLKSSAQKRPDNNSKSETLIRPEVKNSFTDSAEFDLESWLESKISGKSFEDIINVKQQGIKK